MKDQRRRKNQNRDGLQKEKSYKYSNKKELKRSQQKNLEQEKNYQETKIFK